MKLTMKGDYGLRAMLDLAAYYGQGPIESSDIASRQYIPEQYLDQILMALRKEGLIKSVVVPRVVICWPSHQRRSPWLR